MIQALNNFVFMVTDGEPESQYLLPDQAQEPPNKGEVISVGGMVADKKIEEGIKVLFHKGNGFLVEYEGKEYLVLEGERLIAKVS